MQDLLEYLSQKIQEAPDNKKRTYRRDLAKAIINAYPPGRHIRTSEFAKAMRYAGGSSGATTMLTRLTETGHISRELTGNRKMGMYSYKVLKSGNTYDIERAASVDEKPIQEIEAVAQVNIKEEGVEKTYTFEQLEELAIKFQFYNFGISMTVAQFLEKLKEQ